MKSQIALLGIGLVIASGVAYAELKPAANTPTISTVVKPVSNTSHSAAPAATPKSSTKVSTPAPKESSISIISKPTISGGDDYENERDGENEDND